MKASELKQYVEVRHGELSQDEILTVLDVSKNNVVDHIEYVNESYSVWCNDGTQLNFKQRTWR